MRLRTILKPLSFIPALLLMYMIFTFSAQEGEISSDVSYKVSYTAVKSVNYLFDTGLDESQISSYAWRINGLTRKVAHMTEYFLLAVAMAFPLYVYGLRGILLLLVAGGICVAYACLDEYHQSFVSGRAASFKDVGIDSLGVFIGIILVRIIGWTGRHTLFAPDPDDRYEKMTRKERKRYQKRQEMMEQEIRQLRREKAELEQEAYVHSAGSDRHISRPAGGETPYPARDSAPGSPSPYYGHGQSQYAQPSYDDYSQPRYYGAAYGQARPEDDYDFEPEYSSDKLAEDMPLSRLLGPR